MKRQKQPERWFRLDNAGVMYSSLQQERYSAIYRFSAVMTHTVDTQALQNAIYKTMPRFPTFSVRIRRGLFWYYFEPNHAPGPFVKTDVSDPCQPVRFDEDNGWLVRFYAYEKRISIECFHALSDGAGAITFFKTLLACYLRECGHEIPNADGILDVEGQPNPEEFEDAYSRYALKHIHWKAPHLSPAYQNVGTAEPFYTFHVTMGFLPVDQLKTKAKQYGASITEYLAAVLMWVLIQKQKRENPYRELPVALAVPVNLRGLFPSKTLRNFIITVRPVVDPSLGEYTFQEIVDQVHHAMHLQTARQQLQAAITQNVKTQNNLFLKIFPVVIKNPIIWLNYNLRGIKPYSATFTNPGAFRVPAEMQKHIHHMECILGQATVPRVHCAAISFGNRLEITFAGTQKETETERDFFRFLVQEGLPVRIESNRPE